MKFQKLGLILGAGTLIGPASTFANLTVVPTWDATITNDTNQAQIQATINQAIAF